MSDSLFSVFLVLSGVKSCAHSTGMLADFKVRRAVKFSYKEYVRVSSGQARQLTRFFHDINIFITFARQTRLSACLFYGLFFQRVKQWSF